MNTYLTIMLPISGIYFVVMLVILFAFEKSKRHYLKMIKQGYFFVWNNKSFVGISPETADILGLTTRTDNAN
jgi:hypothetical protein